MSNMPSWWNWLFETNVVPHFLRSHSLSTLRRASFSASFNKQPERRSIRTKANVWKLSIVSKVDQFIWLERSSKWNRFILKKWSCFNLAHCQLPIQTSAIDTKSYQWGNEYATSKSIDWGWGSNRWIWYHLFHGNKWPKCSVWKTSASDCKR